MKINFRIIIIFYIAVLGTMTLLCPHSYLLNFSVDDSFFYLKTALNNASGLGSTFDTINQTNGYHPLWFYFLSVSYYLFNLTGSYSPETIYIYTSLLTVAIGAISAGFLHLIIKNITNIDNIQFSTILVLTTILVLQNIIGMETQIFCLLLLMLIYVEVLGVKAGFLRGVLIGLLVLARIDMAIFLAPLLFYYYYFVKKEGWSETGKTFITAGLMFGGYLTYNFIEFGEFTTISSKIKFSGSGFYLKENFIELFKRPIELIHLVFILAVDKMFFFILRIKGKTKEPLIKMLIVLTVSSLIFLFYNQLMNREGIRIWYFGFPALISCLNLAIILQAIKVNKYLIFIPTLLTGIIYFTIFRGNYYYSGDAYNFAKEIKNNTGKEEILYQIDYSGLISFYSERKIINGDGLINSFEYFDAMKSGNLEEHLKRIPIGYYITYAYDNPVVEGIFTDILYRPGGIVFKFRENEIVLKMPKVHGGIFRKIYGNFYLIRYERII